MKKNIITYLALSLLPLAFQQLAAQGLFFVGLAVGVPTPLAAARKWRKLDCDGQYYNSKCT